MNANQVNTGFYFGKKPFGIPTTVGGKGLVAETEADAAKATATSDMDSAAGTCIAAEAAGEEPTASVKVKLKAEADAIKATATLSVKVDTTTAEVKFNASMDSVAANEEFRCTDTCMKDAEWTSSKASKVIIELASSAFVKAEVKESEDANHRAHPLGRKKVLTTLNSPQVRSLIKESKQSYQKPIKNLDSEVLSFQKSINSLDTKISTLGKQTNFQR